MFNKAGKTQGEPSGEGNTAMHHVNEMKKNMRRRRPWHKDSDAPYQLTLLPSFNGGEQCAINYTPPWQSILKLKLSV
jgi:hypothetical protein